MNLCWNAAVRALTKANIVTWRRLSGKSRYEVLEPRRQAVPEHFGSFEPQVAIGLAVRHDHGSVYIGDVFQEELKLLGIQPLQSSPSPSAVA